MQREKNDLFRKFHLREESKKNVYRFNIFLLLFAEYLHNLFMAKDALELSLNKRKMFLKCI